MTGHPQAPSKRCLSCQRPFSQKCLRSFMPLLKLERELTPPLSPHPPSQHTHICLETERAPSPTWQHEKKMKFCPSPCDFFFLPVPESMNARCSHKTSSYLQHSLREYYLLLHRGQEAITELEEGRGHSLCLLHLGDICGKCRRWLFFLHNLLHWGQLAGSD